MTQVTHGSEMIEIDAALERAHKRHPYINPAYRAAFRDFFVQHWAGGEVPRLLRKSTLPDDFFGKLGRRTELQALEAICHDVSMEIYAEYHRRICGH